MATYIGYYHFHPDYARELGERARAGDNSPDPAFLERVIGLRENLPASMTLIGSYNTGVGGPEVNRERPSIWICETDNQADLQFISNFYLGYLVFDWVPATPIGTTIEDARAAMEAAAANL